MINTFWSLIIFAKNPFLDVWQNSEYASLNIICDALRDLVPFAQLWKREKHPWRKVTFSKVAGWSLQLY